MDLIEYHVTVNGDFTMRFQAEDAAHAIEQFIDAWDEPTSEMHTLEARPAY